MMMILYLVFLSLLSYILIDDILMIIKQVSSSNSDENHTKRGNGNSRTLELGFPKLEIGTTYTTVGKVIYVALSMYSRRCLKKNATLRRYRTVQYCTVPVPGSS
jgi:hypothetical protein